MPEIFGTKTASVEFWQTKLYEGRMDKFQVKLRLNETGYEFILVNTYDNKMLFPSYAAAEAFVNNELPDFPEDIVDIILIERLENS